MSHAIKQGSQWVVGEHPKQDEAHHKAQNHQLGNEAWNQRSNKIDTEKNVKHRVAGNTDGDPTGGEPAVQMLVGMYYSIIQKHVGHTSEGMDKQAHGDTGVVAHAGLRFPYHDPRPWIATTAAKTESVSAR